MPPKKNTKGIDPATDKVGAQDDSLDIIDEEEVSSRQETATISFSEKTLSTCLNQSLVPLIDSLTLLVAQGKEAIEVARATQENNLVFTSTIKGLTDMMEVVIATKHFSPSPKARERTIKDSGRESVLPKYIPPLGFRREGGMEIEKKTTSNNKIPPPLKGNTGHVGPLGHTTIPF